MNELKVLALEAMSRVQYPGVSVTTLTDQEAATLILTRRVLPSLLLPGSSRRTVSKVKFKHYIAGRVQSPDTEISFLASIDFLEGQIETRFRIALVSMLEDAKGKRELPNFSELRLSVWRNLHIPKEHEDVALKVFDAVASRVLTEFLTQFTDQLVCEVTKQKMAKTIAELRKRYETTFRMVFENNQQFMFYSLADLFSAPELATIETSSPIELTSVSPCFVSAIEQASRIISLECDSCVSALELLLRATVLQLINDYGPHATRRVINELQWSSACGECSVDDIQKLLLRFVDEIASEEL